MQPIIAKDIIQAVRGELVAGDLDTKITGVSTDTRNISPGDLFVALTGENSDGHKFLADALSKGAEGVVVSHKVEAQCLAIRVPDTLLALGDLAAFYRTKFSPTVVAVTGSVGKTTTKEMIAAVAAAKGPVLKNEGNFNNEIGLPLTLLNLASRHKTAVVEMAMRGAGQIDYLAKIARPSIGVITNIHMSHIELLGSMDAIADAKGELLDHLPADGAAILNADDAYYEYLNRRANCRVVSFGESPHAMVKAISSGIDTKGCCHFEVMTPTGSFDVHIPVPGEHNIKDALAAIAVGEELGIAHDDIRNALAGFKAPEKRSNVIPSRRGYVVIDDTYNAGPASVKSALKTLTMMEGDRKIAILGDMLELGEHAIEAHLEIGRSLAPSPGGEGRGEVGHPLSPSPGGEGQGEGADSITPSPGGEGRGEVGHPLAPSPGGEGRGEGAIDMLVAVGELAKLIARGAIDAGMPIAAVSEFEDSAQAAKEVPLKMRERDVVLVKGSRAMKMERIVEGLLGT